jgi:hypothetical protein
LYSYFGSKEAEVLEHAFLDVNIIYFLYI